MTEREKFCKHFVSRFQFPLVSSQLYRNLEFRETTWKQNEAHPWTRPKVIFQFFNFILLSPSTKFSFCPLLSLVPLMFNFSASQLTPWPIFLYSCQPLSCLGHWSEHWQPPVNPPLLSVHNLFCSLVLKRESRSQEYVWGFQYSLLGSKIHHLGQEKLNSLRGSTEVVNIHYLGHIQNLGQNKITMHMEGGNFYRVGPEFRRRGDHISR